MWVKYWQFCWYLPYWPAYTRQPWPLTQVSLYSSTHMFYIVPSLHTGLYPHMVQLDQLSSLPYYFSVRITGDHTSQSKLRECIIFQGKERQINIPRQIGATYSLFGIFLLEYSTGARIKAIELNCHGDPERISIEILNEWLCGRGKHPVTRNTLVEVLFDIGLATLAAEIEDVRCQTTEQRELFGEWILMCKVAYHSPPDSKPGLLRSSTSKTCSTFLQSIIHTYIYWGGLWGPTCCSVINGNNTHLLLKKSEINKTKTLKMLRDIGIADQQQQRNGVGMIA